MPSAVNPPDSPPRPPVIPEGLATKLGKFGGPLVIALGALADATGVSLDGTSEKTFWAGLGLIALTMAGRYLQAYAHYRNAPSPTQTDDATGEDDAYDEYDQDATPEAAPMDVADDVPISEWEAVLARTGAHPDGEYVPEGAIVGKPLGEDV